MSFDADSYIQQVLDDESRPVIIFALEWCEFCWAIRKFFKKTGVEFATVDLDSVEYQADSKGRQIRNALGERTGMNTIPQVFVGKEFVGGCTDVFDGWKEQRIQELLSKNGVSYDAASTADPYDFLPAWLHPR